MSYDLYFKPRSGAFDSERFAEYFRDRRHYKVEAGQAWYENADTGVYFHFDLQEPDPEEEGEHFPVALNINYFRPAYFVREAEPEVSAFVRHFDLLVADYQTDGMGEGEYDAAKLLSGWDHGNRFAHSAVLGRGKNERPEVVHLPGEILDRAWRWNRDRERLQERLGESKFVPMVMFFRLEGKVVSSCVWPDAIPVAVPSVDVLCIPRKQLAPRKFFRKAEDIVFVAWKDAYPVLAKFGSQDADGVITLDYTNPPPEVEKFVQTLPKETKESVLIAAERVLNSELCLPYLG